MSSLDYLDLCRLCLVKDRVSVPIFEGEGDVRQIFLKIAACLPVKVTREDKLPKKICDDCVYKVELFYQFWNTTANAEKQLLQWLGEVSLEDKQGYVTNVLNPNVMKQEQNSENRLDGNVMQQVSEHQNNMGMGMMDNMGLSIPMIISNANQQQITSVPMDTNSNTVQTVQAVPGPSSQSTHNQIPQNQTTSAQQEDEDESSEDDENSDEDCDGDEGLPVKEESEEDPSNRTIEPTTFVNVSLACDEAGPSGLQQQKMSDMPEMPIPQPTDGDPKSGRDPLEQTYLVVQNVDKYFLLPVDHKELIEKPGGRLSIGGGMVIKSEEHDIPEETSEQSIEPAEPERPQTDETPQSRTDLPVEMPLQLSQWFEQGSNSSGSIPASSAGNKKTSNCCDYCSRVFRRKYELKRHLATHSNTRVECSVCHQFLKTKRTLNLHMKLHEESDKMFECTECDFRSKRMPSMKRHQIRKHSMHANFKCDICSRVFKLNSDLTRHNQLKHLIEPCCCDICGRTYRNMFFLRKHWYLAKKRKKSCDRMRWRGIRSRNVDYATAQKKAESSQVYNCPKCKWRFKNKNLLDRHMQRHLLSFNCETCGAVFKYRASFLKHQEAHKNEQE